MVKKKSLPKATTNRMLTDMKLFHARTDWVGMWEDFYLGLKPDGTKKYKNVWGFTCANTESDEQKEFMHWFIGPIREEKDKDPEDKKFAWAGIPQDWTKKRNEGGWFTSKNLQLASSEIRRRGTVLDAMEELGRSVTLNSVVRVEQLSQKVDKYFKGEPLLEDLSLAENTARSTLYIKLQKQLIELAERTFTLFAKTHGVDFNDLSTLTQFYQAAVISQQARSEALPAKTREQTAVEAIVNMTLTKAHRYQLPLPEIVETTIAEAVAEESPKEKKRKMQ